MNWFTWRQHRKQFLIFGLLMAVFTTFVVLTGNHYWSTYQNALTTCAANPNAPGCSDLSNSLLNTPTDGLIRIGVVLGTFGLPLLLGLFMGSPLLAREYEEGTNKLAWTQGVSRRKWLTTKLAWALGFALLYGIVLVVLVTWWSRTLNTLNSYRFVQGHFETQGLMPVAYSIFFTCVGFMTGAWFRKTLLSIGITFAVFVLCMAGFANWIRPHYITPITVTTAMGPGVIDKKIPDGAWVLRRDIIDKNNKVFNSFDIGNMPAECQQLTQNIRVPDGSHVARVKAEGGDPVDDCLNTAGFHQIARYQPSYRYWDFQRIEAGIYLSFSILLIGATYWLVLKRDA